MDALLLKLATLPDDKFEASLKDWEVPEAEAVVLRARRATIKAEKAAEIRRTEIDAAMTSIKEDLGKVAAAFRTANKVELIVGGKRITKDNGVRVWEPYVKIDPTFQAKLAAALAEKLDALPDMPAGATFKYEEGNLSINPGKLSTGGGGGGGGTGKGLAITHGDAITEYESSSAACKAMGHEFGSGNPTKAIINHVKKLRKEGDKTYKLAFNIPMSELGSDAQTALTGDWQEWLTFATPTA